MVLIDGDFFEGIADISFGDPYIGVKLPNLSVLKNKIDNLDRTPILYIDTARLILLLNIVNNLMVDVIIIAHNSDTTFGDDIIGRIPKNVIRVWCQNFNGTSNDKIKPLPIGLERKRWFPEQGKQNIIKEYVNTVTIRDKKVYMNFLTSTNPIRNKWFEHLNNKSFIVTEMLGHRGKYQPYINNILKYKYIISPPGNGIDCHRNWEALYMGCIPIVQKSNFTINMFSDMPVLLVDGYVDINEELISGYELQGSLEKLKCGYWENKIKQDVITYEKN